MEFGRNGKGPCGKRAKWSLGEMGKLDEMVSGRNEKWAKMKLGETAKGQDKYRAVWEKGEVGKGEKRIGETEKKFGRNGNGRNGIGQIGNKPVSHHPRYAKWYMLCAIV